MTDSNPKINLLVLCTGNSARSVIAEALFNKLAGDRFCCYSAGSTPTGRVNPYAIAQLQKQGMNTAHLHSKSWLEFTQPESPKMDILVTVCKSAAHEVCPVFHKDCEQVHWGLPDPAAVTGSPEGIAQAFHACFEQLSQHIGNLKLAILPDSDCTQVAQTMRNVWKA